MSYAGRPLDPDRLAEAVARMIVMHRDRPCPTRTDIRAWTDLPKRKVWRFMAELQARGLIEIESRSQDEGTSRRMRLVGGQWTGWTARRKPATERPRLLERMMDDASA